MLLELLWARSQIAKSVYWLRLFVSAFLSVCQFVRLSVRTEQLGSQWTNFHSVLYLSIFLKPIDKIQV
jgi:hypothetical protein